MAVPGVAVSIVAGLLLAGVLGIVYVREIAKAVLLLVYVLTLVSVLLYWAWGLGLAAAYFMLSVGGLAILILLAASIVEPAAEPKASPREYLAALLPAGLIAWAIYCSLSDAKQFSKPVFFSEEEALVAGLIMLVALLAGLYLLARRWAE
ncbi:hypothetical protein PYJP_17300 [Pyrofollis japonicus]|uniref:hypothetical protein n=1 Tax=Pyrofollis japonicus TaxID=3060460 RepID=UPI00295BD8FF|nr:hypothetical protein [Pyrofollis japonicus]BEP18378.1 hypothetical protein PYJP_17300 [Pyrofollis japonicus]